MGSSLKETEMSQAKRRDPIPYTTRKDNGSIPDRLRALSEVELYAVLATDALEFLF
jgi:hypothetical protein